MTSNKLIERFRDSLPEQPGAVRYLYFQAQYVRASHVDWASYELEQVTADGEPVRFVVGVSSGSGDSYARELTGTRTERLTSPDFAEVLRFALAHLTD